MAEERGWGAGKQVSPLYIHFKDGQMKVSRCERTWVSQGSHQKARLCFLSTSINRGLLFLYFFQSLVTWLSPGAIRGKSPTRALPSGLGGCVPWLRVAAWIRPGFTSSLRTSQLSALEKLLHLSEPQFLTYKRHNNGT